MKHFPVATYLLVDANEVHADALDTFCAEHPNAQRVIAAAGNQDGECMFDGSDPGGGSAYTEAVDEVDRIVPMISLDNEVERRKLCGPFLLKLDTHGFELQILEGAKNILRDTNLVIIESYVFRLHSKSHIFHELCTYMDSIGFLAIDFSEPMWRKNDMALWQFDLFFVPKHNNVFSSNSFS